MDKFIPGQSFERFLDLLICKIENNKSIQIIISKSNDQRLNNCVIGKERIQIIKENAIALNEFVTKFNNKSVEVANNHLSITDYQGSLDDFSFSIIQFWNPTT